ncbi:hypothetical protein ACFYKX_25575 [Cytobacillus sp. FJAT-54145]|uniref:Uncharacterized protein n=1 Tax=Cytobacillus spartinae TaxID=3299023 RepID=A0ABW6KIB0_9BACI
MMTVTIVDSRPKWMKTEDERAACFINCSMYSQCQSRFGCKCSRLGGSEIPKFQVQKRNSKRFSH